MKQTIFNIFFLIMSSFAITATAGPATQTMAASDSQAVSATQNPVVVIHTNKGDITLELYAEQAPVTVANFLEYAKSGFYNGTIFHRVIKRFMIQGGGFTEKLKKKSVNAPIVNESSNGLHNDRWTVAMARTLDPDSATSQFYINAKMNSQLDSARGKPGYTVFGIVIDGQYVVKAIEKTATQAVGRFEALPNEAIIIESVDIKS